MDMSKKENLCPLKSDLESELTLRCFWISEIAVASNDPVGPEIGRMSPSYCILIDDSSSFIRPE